MRSKDAKSDLIGNLIVRNLSDVEEIEKVPIENRIDVRTTYEVIDHIARQYGELTAIHWLPKGYPSSEDKKISYKAFASRIRQTANYIRSCGLKRSDVVAYLLPNLPETHIVIAGAQTACIVMPLNPLLEIEHLVNMLDIAGAKIIVTVHGGKYAPYEQKARAIAKKVKLTPEIICIDLEEDLSDGFYQRIDAHADDVLEFDYDAKPHHNACYMHTGGTTGTPKLTPHTQWGEVSQAWTLASLGDIRPSDSIIAGLPLFHASAFRITGIGTWIAGASIILIGPDGYRNSDSIERFWETVEAYEATSFIAVATVYSALLNIPLMGRDISSIRLASSGAAPLPVEIIERFDEKFNIQISEGYGLTEGTCISSRNPQDGKRKIGSIGLRVPYQDMKIVEVDDKGKWRRDCVAGETGIIAIKGPNVATAYLQTEKNMELQLGDGWINTGDLARCDSEGYFFITGRRKDIIIRGGHNIDPILIEDILHSHPDIELAAAVAMPDIYAGELPVAFVTLKAGSTITAQQLYDFAFQNITERPAAPKKIFIIASMPLTPVGKLSKLLLRCRAIEHALMITVADRLPNGTNCICTATPCEQNGIHVNIEITAPAEYHIESFKAAAISLVRSFSFSHELLIHAVELPSVEKKPIGEENMKQIELSSWGVENIRLTTVPRPEPSENQVLVKMAAATLNFRDLLVVQGIYNPKMPLPLIPVSDGAGVIVATGSNAKKFKEGSRVMPIHVPGWLAGRGEPNNSPHGGPNPGVLAEYVVFDERDLVVTPPHLTEVEAAALPCAGVTAWNALFGGQAIMPGSRVLILGTGGVALFALQFAKIAGAEVAITSKDDTKLAKAKFMGADHLINYKDDPDWGVTAKNIFDGNGADLVIELGGAKTLSQSLRAVKRGGEIAMIGSVTGAEVEQLKLPPIFMRNITMRGIAVGSRDTFEDMTRAVALHKVKPVIDVIYSGLESFSDALKALPLGEHFGKIALEYEE